MVQDFEDSHEKGVRRSHSFSRKIFGSSAPALMVILIFATLARAETTIPCPAGTYDMLDWMTLDSDLRATYHLEGTSNPLYTVMYSDKFYWVKGGLGYPWDIQLYDGKYIYLWIT